MILVICCVFFNCSFSRNFQNSMPNPLSRMLGHVKLYSHLCHPQLPRLHQAVRGQFAGVRSRCKPHRRSRQRLNRRHPSVLAATRPRCRYLEPPKPLMRRRLEPRHLGATERVDNCDEQRHRGRARFCSAFD